MEIQEKVVTYIREHGIMQKFICQKTGFSAPKVSAIMNMNQKITADEFALLCKALGKNPNDFMNIEE